jgi:hypothetical protein
MFWHQTETLGERMDLIDQNPSARTTPWAEEVYGVVKTIMGGNEMS